MSKYTTELRFICEMNSGFPVDEMASYQPDEIIAAARTKIFDFAYPIYDEAHRPELETKILKHFYTREIGSETVGLWKFRLNTMMNEIMPKYNELYKTQAAIMNKELKNVDIETTSNRTDDFSKESDYVRTDNLASSRSETTSGTRATADKYSDTPQGSLSGVDDNTYLSDYRKIDGTESGSLTATETNTGTQRNAGSETNEGTQSITGTEKGYRGGKLYLEILAEYAKQVLNIDMMIINELNGLFMLLW